LNEGNLSFTVETEDAGKRLDAYLAERVEGHSRSRIQKMIEAGDVLLNEAETKASFKLRAGDELEVELSELEADSFEPEDIPLEILYEDEHLAVINKPAGLVVHPGAGIKGGTLANAVAYHFGFRNSDFGFRDAEGSLKDGDSVGSQIRNPQSAIRNRIGIVHRLDKLTSGLIVVAKTEQAHENLSEQFRDRKVYKRYMALVHGEIWEDTGTIDAPIAREKHNRTKMGVRAHGRAALSIWRVRERFEKFTLLDVEIKTGRTHQIRVHLAHMNHPVVGDETYNAGRDKTVANLEVRQGIAALGRFFLHAEKLSFDHPVTGKRMNFTAPLPDELTGFLELL
jgi:23S rRNA pseudouridine1911/1915/1917 synthase